MDHRVARCHLLALVLADDGIMTEEERALLERHLANHELSEAECEEVRSGKGSDEANAIASRNAASGVMSRLTSPATPRSPNNARVPLDSQMMLWLTRAPGSTILNG